MIGMLIRKTEPYQKWPSSHPLRDRPDGASATGGTRPDGDRLRPLLGWEHVDQDRQGRWHDERAAEAHQRPTGDELPHLARHGGQRSAGEEQHQAGLQRPLTTEAVADRSRGEEQTGEDERVDRHDPLQLRGGGRQVTRQRRDRHVQARVPDEDDEQAQTEHPERVPATIVDVLSGGIAHPGTITTCLPLCTCVI